MIKQTVFAGILLPLLMILSACSFSSNSSDESSVQELSTRDSSYVSIEDTEDVDVIEETQFYKIIYSDSMYYYYIFNENHDVVKSDGPLNKEPHISMVNDHLIRFTLQAGTGIGTQWGYYYDTIIDTFSPIFQSIYDQCDGKVAYGEVGKIIIRDIFDQTKYYQEISSFRKPLSVAAEPIIKSQFVNGGTGIKVTYLTGPDYEEVTETIDLA